MHCAEHRWSECVLHFTQTIHQHIFQATVSNKSTKSHVMSIKLHYKIISERTVIQETLQLTEAKCPIVQRWVEYKQGHGCRNDPLSGFNYLQNVALEEQRTRNLAFAWIYFQMSSNQEECSGGLFASVHCCFSLCLAFEGMIFYFAKNNTPASDINNACCLQVAPVLEGGSQLRWNSSFYWASHCTFIEERYWISRPKASLGSLARMLKWAKCTSNSLIARLICGDLGFHRRNPALNLLWFN